MVRGMTTAASGMLADERLQQMLANNLANLETPGFKATDGALLSFPQQLLERMNYGSSSGPVIGTMGTGVVLQEGIPLMLQGDLQAANNPLDVAIVDNAAPGTYAAVVSAAVGANGTSNSAGVVSVRGAVTVGAGGRLEVAGQPLAVLDGNGRPLPGVYAARNPKYTGSVLFAADGSPNRDAAGQPSYVYVNAQNVQIGVPGQSGFNNASIRVGTEATMGSHSFFAVAYQSGFASGLALTRDGAFSLDAGHDLVDAAGHPVLPVDANGKPIPNGRIHINPAYQGRNIFQADGRPLTDGNGQLSYTVIDTNGNSLAGAQLGTVNADATQLSPLGQTEFMVGGSLNAAQVLALLSPGNGQMKPGQIEQSNVDVTSTVTQMTALASMYQANANLVQAENTMLGLAVSDVGKVG